MTYKIKPISKKEILELFEKEDSICKIYGESIINGRLEMMKATGFFLELNIKDIPFNKCLLTNIHIFEEEAFKIGKEIEIEYKNKIQIIKFTKNRKIFSNRDLNYICIEILNDDSIKQFFKIDINLFENKLNIIKDKEFFLLQFYKDTELRYSNGIILEIKDNKIIHNCPSGEGSTGSPLIYRYNLDNIVGIHYGFEKKPF